MVQESRVGQDSLEEERVRTQDSGESKKFKIQMMKMSFSN